MPLVLITGLNGFVAVPTALHFLKQGWTVRGTVRTEEKRKMVMMLPALKEHVKAGHVEVVVVDDLEKGDFMPALKGCDALAHIASPWHMHGERFADYRDPAVKGTTNVLTQAAKCPSIKAVATVSSFAAVMRLEPYAMQDGVVYSEKDWLPITEAECEAMNKDDPVAPVTWYCASKKFAEMAAYETWERTGKTYSLATILAPMIFGPPMHCMTKTELADGGVSTSTLAMLLTGGKETPIPDNPFFSPWADVRDIAEAVFKTINARANGRYLTASGLFSYQMICNIAHSKCPKYAQYFAVGKPGEDMLRKSYKLDCTKSIKELGMTYIGLEQMIMDTVEHMAQLGAYA